jgi:hypothetical protein
MATEEQVTAPTGEMFAGERDESSEAQERIPLEKT